MHLSSTLFSVIVATLVSGQAEFPFERNGECIEKCSLSTGSKLVDGFTVDPKSPNFMKSLDLYCDKTGPNYNAYMNEAMECMGACPQAELDGFMKNFRPVCNWYGEAVGKDTTTNALNKSSSSAISATSSQESQTPVPTKSADDQSSSTSATSIQDSQTTAPTASAGTSSQDSQTPVPISSVEPSGNSASAQSSQASASTNSANTSATTNQSSQTPSTAKPVDPKTSQNNSNSAAVTVHTSGMLALGSLLAIFIVQL